MAHPLTTEITKMAKVYTGAHYDALTSAIDAAQKAFTTEASAALDAAPLKYALGHLKELRSKNNVLAKLTRVKNGFGANQKKMIIDNKMVHKGRLNVEINNIKIDIGRIIKKYNGCVQTLRKRPVAVTIPTIKKTESIKKSIATNMTNGKDTIDDIEYGEGSPSISLCSRKKNGHFLIQKENLIGLLDAYLSADNVNLWSVASNNVQPFPNDWSKAHFVTSSIRMKCQGKPVCDQMIKLHTLLSHLAIEDRKSYKRKYVALYLILMKNKYPERVSIFYCKNVKCACAETGFMYPKYPIEKTQDMIFCEKCDTKHHVHHHHVECTLCMYSFCDMCGEYPYHDNRVCYGPLSDDIKLLLASSDKYKPCPACKIPSEKASGCDHITCGNVACGVHWCWRCLQKLNQNDPYRHDCLSENVVADRVDGAYRDYDVPVDDIPAVIIDPVAVDNFQEEESMSLEFPVGDVQEEESISLEFPVGDVQEEPISKEIPTSATNHKRAWELGVAFAICGYIGFSLAHHCK